MSTTEISNSPWSGRGNLVQLVEELERQKNSKIDFVTDTRSLLLSEEDGILKLSGSGDKEMSLYLGEGEVPFRPSAVGQLSEKCDPPIPIGFLRKLLAKRPGRTSELVNNLIHDVPAKRFIRILDGNVRAVLSSNYRVMDNYDLAFSALDTVREVGGEVIEATLSDNYMKIKFTSRAIFDSINEGRNKNSNWFAGGLGNQDHLARVGAKTNGELPGGSGTVHPLVVISNSETGQGGFKVSVGILRAICFNLAVVEDCLSKMHLGEKMELGMYSSETLSSESKTISLKSRDVIKSAFSEETFGRIIEIAKEAQSDKISEPVSAVKNIVKVSELSEIDSSSILQYFMSDSDSTRYGIAQAVSRTAQDSLDPDKASKLEELSGRLLRSGELLEV